LLKPCQNDLHLTSVVRLGEHLSKIYSGFNIVLGGLGGLGEFGGLGEMLPPNFSQLQIDIIILPIIFPMKEL
jgi:hypothetical protein